MTSLKAFLPHLAKLLGTTSDALYSRQRALVALGVLDAVKGRGPGSGTALNARSVAGLLIALLSADSLQETDGRVLDLCRARPRDGRCPLTGASDFHSAMAAILESQDHCKSLHRVAVYRPHRAQILYGSENSSHGSVFDVIKTSPSGAIEISSRLGGQSFRQISASLTAALTM